VTQAKPYVLSFGSAHGDAAWKAGPKAANLSLFSSAGFPVPGGFVITTDALEDVLGASGLAGRVNDVLAEIDAASPGDVGRQPEVLRGLVASATVPGEIASAVSAVYAAMGGKPVSVRSSSTLEDRLNVSFAGQHDTVLNILNEEELWQAIKICWASLWTDRAVHYLRAMDMSAREMKMAVVVQELIEADASGVAFTIHPISGDRTQVVVYAALGLGEGTVSGEVSPDEATLSRDPLKVVDFTLGTKATKVVADAGGGTQYVELSAAERARLSISPEQVLQVAELALNAEGQVGGVPQDVEWALSNGQLHLLQARPLSRPAPPDAGVTWNSPVPGAHWRRNWRLGEWLSGPVTPLFSTWLLPMLVASREETGTGELGWEMNDHSTMPKPWSCIVNGYFYTRQDRARRAAPADVPDVDRRLRMTRMNLEELNRWRSQYLPAYLKRFKGHQRFDTAQATSREVVAFVDRLTREAGEFWHLMAIAGYGFQETMFKPVYEHLVPEKGRPPYVVLFSGYRNKTIAGQEKLHALAQRIKEDSPVAQRFLTTTPDVIAQTIDELPAWLQQEFEELREQYGHELYSLDIYYPTVGETPEVTIAMIQSYLRSETHSPYASTRTAARRRTRATRWVNASMADQPEELAKLQEIMLWFQSSSIAREDEAFYFQRPWPLIRRSVLELGCRLAEAGALDDAAGVFFLENEELTGLLAALDRGDQVGSLHDVAMGRKQTWEHHGRLAPPDRLPADFVSERFMDRVPGLVEDDEGRWIIGQAASPGRARGRARIIRSPEDAGRFVKGDVLITVAAIPAFTPLLLLASGLVTEAGGGASHSSLVARELGVPAVVNTGVATQIINDGQLLEVDGTQGVVRLL
jgi:phosphohistidine swiveling domain-containing protein